MAITIQLPEPIERELASIWGEAALAQKVAEDLVIEAYRIGVISRGKVGELLGMSVHAREAFLKERDVPYNYDAEDLDEDLRTMSRYLEQHR